MVYLLYSYPKLAGTELYTNYLFFIPIFCRACGFVQQLIQADAASRRGLIQALATIRIYCIPMTFIVSEAIMESSRRFTCEQAGGHQGRYC